MGTFNNIAWSPAYEMDEWETSLEGVIEEAMAYGEVDSDINADAPGFYPRARWSAEALRAEWEADPLHPDDPAKWESCVMCGQVREHIRSLKRQGFIV